MIRNTMIRHTMIPVGLMALAVVTCASDALRPDRWSANELRELRSLWIGELAPLPADPSNRVADDPRAVMLGHALFFEERLSSNGRISCASCHLPDRQFQDGVPLATGVGTTDRRTMPVAGTAYSPWLFWDGRSDSQWAQALGPLESPVEHDITRAQVAHLVARHHAEPYTTLFGELPVLDGVPLVAGPVPDPVARSAWEALSPAQQDAITRVYVNVGKAIAAFERRIQYGPSRVDRYIEVLLRDGQAPAGVLNPDEVAGMRLFTGKANCTQCHNGPLLTNDHFHNTGVPAVVGLPPDVGRAAGVLQALAGEFNCRSRWSDANPADCTELDFAVTEGEELVRAFKTPSLRNVAERPPYMHAGQFATLEDVVAHYVRAPASPVGRTELEPLRLSRRERAQLVAFLRALTGPLDAPAELLAPPGRTGGER